MVKGKQRSQKWYFKNEEEVMKELGLKPAKGSGSGWVEKEDGENDHIICQLKSTDHSSYKLTQLDMDKLMYHAQLANKAPMFLLQFLNKDDRYAVVRLEDIPTIAEFIKTGEVQNHEETFDIKLGDSKPKRKRKKPVVKSSKNAKQQFYEEKQKKWEDIKYGNGSKN